MAGTNSDDSSEGATGFSKVSCSFCLIVSCRTIICVLGMISGLEKSFLVWVMSAYILTRSVLPEMQ